VKFSARRFLSWTDGELAKVAFGMKKKKPKKKTWVLQYVQKWIPVPYARLIHQYILEVKHGRKDDSHEATRRMAYAERMLEAFGRELEGYKGKREDFRSKVLNPVLQRQLCGIPDNYAAPICDVMAGDGEVTIYDATVFYLANDPLNPRCIPSYRRNLIYIREARWHLGVLEGVIKVESNYDFDWVLKNHNSILDGLGHESSEEEEDGKDGNPIPKLRRVEVEVIVVERLNSHFAYDLNRVVCTEAPPHTMDANPRCHQPRLVEMAAETEPGSPPAPRPPLAKSHKRRRSSGEPSRKLTKRQKTKKSERDVDDEADVEDEAEIGDSEMEEAQTMHNKDGPSGTKGDGPDEGMEEEQTAQDKGDDASTGGGQPDEEMEAEPTMQDEGCGSRSGNERPDEEVEGEKTAHGSGVGGNQPDEGSGVLAPHD